MNWKYGAVTLGFLALLAAAAGQPPPGQPGRDEPGGNAHGGTGLVQIRALGDELAIGSVCQLVRSSPVLGRAVSNVFGPLPEQLASSVEVSCEPMDEAHQPLGSGQELVTALFEIEVTIDPELPGQAEALLAALVKRLDAALVAQSTHRQELLAQQAEHAQQRALQAEQRLAEIHARGRELQAQAGDRLLRRDVIEDELSAWVRELGQTEKRLAGLNARQQTLAEQIAQLGRETTQSAAQDPVAAELAKVVALREQELERMRKLAGEGRASAAEVAPVEERVALARAELSRHKQEMAHAAGGGLLPELNNRLVEVAVDLAETQAMREFLRARLDEARARNLHELADQYELEVRNRLELAQTAALEARQQQLEIEQQLAAYSVPSVRLLGGE